MMALRASYRVLAVAAAVWALAVAAYFLLFAKISYESITVSASQGELPVTTRESGQAPWVTEAGPTAVVVMLTLSLLLTVGAAAAWRGVLPVAAPISLLTLVAAFVTGFTIGGFYLPAASGLAICAVLLAIERLSRRPTRPAA